MLALVCVFVTYFMISDGLAGKCRPSHGKDSPMASSSLCYSIYDYNGWNKISSYLTWRAMQASNDPSTDPVGIIGHGAFESILCLQHRLKDRSLVRSFPETGTGKRSVPATCVPPVRSANLWASRVLFKRVTTNSYVCPTLINCSGFV